MPMNLRGRSLLSLVHHTPAEIDYLVDLAIDLKKAKRMGNEVQRLKGKNIALIFEKTSTRTRSAFEVGAHDQGAGTTFFESHASQIGHKESIKDTARVLGQIYDAIEFRGFKQETVEELAAYAGVPVYNGLTDEWHPTQMLCDLMTMKESCGKAWKDISFAYLGDARFNTGNSLLMIGAKMGMDVRIGAPKAYWPSAEIIALAEELAAVSGAHITITEDPNEAVAGVDFIHTDIWVSMGEPAEVWAERIALLKPYQVNAALMAASGNPQVKFMHCLPAYHNDETKVGANVIAEHPELADGVEVTEEVFERLSLLGECRNHQRFDGVHTVASLFKDDRRRRLKHFLRHFHAVGKFRMLRDHIGANLGFIIVIGRQTMHELHLRIPRRSHQGGINLIGLQKCNTFCPNLCRFTHRHPDVGVNEVNTRHGFVGILCDGNVRAGNGSQFFSQSDDFCRRPVGFRCADAHVHTHLGTNHQQRIAGIEAGIAKIGKRNVFPGFAAGLLHRHQIAKHLRRMPFIGQAVVDRNAGVCSQLFNRFLLEAAELNGVIDLTEHTSRVLDAFLVPDL